jgi:diguanylate cyclase (GGDEF)-like protein
MMIDVDVLALNRVYDYPLGALSLTIAILAVYAVFDLAVKLSNVRGASRFVRMSGGAFSLGMALWVMQFAGLPILRLPVPVGYDWPTMLFSLFAATAAGGTALWAVSRKTVSVTKSLCASVLVGGMLTAMRYAGDASIRMPGIFLYSYSLAALSVLLVIVISFVTMTLAFAMKEKASGWNWVKLSWAVVIGLAITALHFIEVASVSPKPLLLNNTDLTRTINFPYASRDILALVTIVILILLLITLMLDRSASQHTLELQLNEERHRMAIAITAQRVTRLENEALTEEIQERKKVEAALNHAAFHDSLTGLHNRVYFMERLTTALKRKQGRDKTRSAVIYIDLDNFKAVNDMLGHRAGDLVLCEIAERLEKCTRDQDTLARMGGDEFILLLGSFQNIEQAFRMTQRLLNVIEEPLQLAGMRLPVSASMGLCEVGTHYSQAEDILRDADTAMYHAKRQGGARCVIYDTSMHEEALSTLQAKLQLKAAVENREFELYYQPLVNMRDVSIHGMEALIRWNHPTRGLLGPHEFIQLAEDSGHIIAIGSWVLRQACSDFQGLQKSTSDGLMLSVNVSTRQLEEETFFTELSGVIKESGIDPRALQLEITESIFLKDAGRIGTLFKEVRALGVRIAFDDFGTGYSSLSYLEKYPIDTLKIDQSFVQHMRKGSVNADIVQLTIKLAQAIGMSVSAEGVEEPEQAVDLLEYGCAVAQGYLYSKPISLSAMVAVLSHGINSKEKLERTIE